MLKTIKAYINWNAIILAAVYHPPTSMPMPQVSFRTSSVQNPHQIMREYNMILAVLSNLASCILMIANAIRMISSISL